MAIAVNPNDKRYKKLIGKYALLPFVNRKLPIIGDEYVDMTTDKPIVLARIQPWPSTAALSVHVLLVGTYLR